MNSPMVVSINLPADLAGEKDTRPGTWGTTGVRLEKYQFLNIPAGHRVRILRISGDLTSCPRNAGVPGTFCGVLWGLCRSSVTEQGESKTLQYGSDGCLIYVQDVISSDRGSRASFNRSIPVDSPDGLLDADGIMLNKIAIFLNETGQSIHVEATANITFQYVEET